MIWKLWNSLSPKDHFELKGFPKHLPDKKIFLDDNLKQLSLEPNPSIPERMHSCPIDLEGQPLIIDLADKDLSLVVEE